MKRDYGYGLLALGSAPKGPARSITLAFLHRHLRGVDINDSDRWSALKKTHSIMDRSDPVDPLGPLRCF